MLATPANAAADLHSAAAHRARARRAAGPRVGQDLLDQADGLVLAGVGRIETGLAEAGGVPCAPGWVE